MLITKIKTDLRISHNQLDNEILNTINGCKLDLINSGINVDEPLSAIKENAIKLYCRAWYDLGGKGEQWQKNYESLKVSLALTDESQGEVNNV